MGRTRSMVDIEPQYRPERAGTETKNNRLGKKKYREAFANFEGHMLTPYEERFIEEYLENGGNATQAMIDAGYKSVSSKTAQELMNRPHISREIKHRMEEAKSARTADATEILEFLTSAMRGEVTDQFGLDPTLSDRMGAAKELAKRIIDLPARMQAKEAAPEVRISLNWARADDETTIDVVTREKPSQDTTEDN